MGLGVAEYNMVEDHNSWKEEMMGGEVELRYVNRTVA